jgi:hypothetical protein
MEIVSIFYGPLEYFTDIWDILFRFWYHVCTEKNLATLPPMPSRQKKAISQFCKTFAKISPPLLANSISTETAII